MIRFILGFVLVLGAVGELDYNTNAEIASSTVLAGLGLILMHLGAEKLKNQ